MGDQLVLKIEVRRKGREYEAVSASGTRETSGNPYVAVVNLLDSVTDQEVSFDVRFRGRDSGGPRS